MKRFIGLVFLFLILSLGAVVVIFTAASLLISGNKNFKLPDGTEGLVMGHSHPACAFSDSLIPGILNVAQNTEGYPYTYFKLKKILEANPELRFVLLEYTNNQVSQHAEARVAGEYLRVNMGRNFPVMPPRFVAGMMKGNGRVKDIADAIKTGLSTNFGFLFSESRSFIDYAWRDYKTPDHVFDPPSSVIKPDPRVFQDVYSVDWTNLNYLVKIRDLTAEKNVKLIFVRSPLPLTTQRNNELVFRAVLKEQFDGIPFLDFVDFPLPNEYFADHQHLNIRGQEVFSVYFRDLINRGMLVSPDPENFPEQHPFRPSDYGLSLPEDQLQCDSLMHF